MIWNRLRDHEPIVAMFRRAVGRHRLAHAYLFHGPAGVGKRYFATLMAQALFCEKIPEEQFDACGTCRPCRMMQAGSHPDFLTVSRPEDKSIIPIELLAGSEENRGREGLCYEMSLRPLSGNRRIALIDDTDRFNEESGNALLKTLEEPSARSLLILLSADPERLLPTIRSRCQEVRFAPLAEQTVAELVQQLGWVETADEARLLAELSQGSLETARQLTEPAVRQLRQFIHETLTDSNFNTAKVSRLVLEQVQNVGESARQREAALWVVRFCVEEFRNRFRHIVGENSGNEHSLPADFLDSRRPAELAERLIRRCAEAEQHLAGFANLSLCLHSFFDDIGRLLRQGGHIVV